MAFIEGLMSLCNESEVSIFFPPNWYKFACFWNMKCSWFQSFAVFWILFVFFWVFPRRPIVVCRLHTLHPALEDGTDRGFRNVGKPQSYAGEIPKRIHTKYKMIYQLDAIEYLFVFFQLDMFRAYTPIFRSNGCYSFFTYAAYGVL